MLLLKKHLIDLVRAGKKTQTIRLWKRPMVREKQLAYTPGLGRVLIVSVEKIQALSELTRADAIADGFASLAALRAELRAIYGKRRDRTKSLYRVRFHFPAPVSNQVSTSTSTSIPVPAQPKSRRAPGAKKSKRQMRYALAAHLRKRTG